MAKNNITGTTNNSTILGTPDAVSKYMYFNKAGANKPGFRYNGSTIQISKDGITWAEANSGFAKIDLQKGAGTDSTGVATVIGAAYINNSTWSSNRTVKFRCVLESTDATVTYAAIADLYDTSGSFGVPAQVSGSQIDNTGASSQLVATMIEANVTTAFTTTVAGVFEVRLWIANTGGSNIVTCKSAQLIIEE